MGIHHSSDTKTSHDHDNNCQMCHSTASLSQAGRMVADRRLRRLRWQPGGGYGVRARSRARARSGPLGRARRRSAHLRLASTNNKTEPTPLPGQHNAFYLQRLACWKYPCFSSLYDYEPTERFLEIASI